ncbi:MAG: formyltetrahydrofolate deformylase [Sphingobacteriales bacterium]|nr:formyltetrahydrofolate deformylase [Sphingobacteriales bacterium]
MSLTKPATPTPSQLIVRISCPDEKGLIYRISKVIFEEGYNIIENDEFVDEEKDHFFYRCVLSAPTTTDEGKQLVQRLRDTLLPGAFIEALPNRSKKILLMATKEHHCLGDLLLRCHYRHLNAQIVGVVSNHEILRDLVEKFHLPFHCISAEGLSREAHEAQVLELLQTFSFDYIVLAKYMRILSSEFVQHYRHRIINIHHSFLPAFIGANPYRQAFERGVKIVGATAHFVNENLDDGPIIHQDITRTDHNYNDKEMARMGKDVETLVLAKALEWVLQERVMINGNKTIIF